MPGAHHKHLSEILNPHDVIFWLRLLNLFFLQEDVAVVPVVRKWQRQDVKCAAWLSGRRKRTAPKPLQIKGQCLLLGRVLDLRLSGKQFHERSLRHQVLHAEDEDEVDHASDGHEQNVPSGDVHIKGGGRIVFVLGVEDDIDFSQADI